MLSQFFLIKIFIYYLSSCCDVLAAYNLTDYANQIHLLTHNRLNKEMLANIKRLKELEPNYFSYNPIQMGRIQPFQCIIDLGSSKATSVHRLRPSDIKAVGAMGDSLTASLGSFAQSILGLLIEFRGRSFSHGGDLNLESLVTMPNILKKFNPSIKGTS